MIDARQIQSVMKRAARLHLTARRWRVIARKRQERTHIVYSVDGIEYCHVPDEIWDAFAFAEVCTDPVKNEYHLQSGMSHFIQIFDDIPVALHGVCWENLSDLAQQYRVAEGVAHAACRYFADRSFCEHWPSH